MKLKILVILVAPLVGVGASAFAAPLDGNQVAVDAKWVAHFDLDAVKTATLAEKVLRPWFSNELVRLKLDGIKTFTGIDLKRDLHGVTSYGNRLAKNTGVVIFHANVDGPRLVGIAQRNPGYKATDFGKHTLHTWIERKDLPDEHTVTGCVFGPDLLIVGRDGADVKAALDVLDGKSAALAGSDSPLAGEVPEGAVFMARVAGLAELELPFKSPIVNESELLWAALGERDGPLGKGEVFGQLKFVAKSDDLAKQVEDVVRGLRAMALLHHGSDEEAKKIVEGLKVTTSQRTVHVEWRGAAEGVWRLIEQELKKQ